MFIELTFKVNRKGVWVDEPKLVNLNEVKHFSKSDNKINTTIRFKDGTEAIALESYSDVKDFLGIAELYV